MKQSFLFLIIFFVFFIGCQTNKKNKTTTDTGLTINYDTESGIPEFSAISNDSVKLKYQFTKYKRIHSIVDYNMAMEVMGQRIPLILKMESDFEVKNVEENGNADITMQFTRVKMDMNGPLVLKYDSDEVTDLSSNPLASSLAPLINTPMRMVVSPLGHIIKMELESILKAMSDTATNGFQAQINNISQISQNIFVPLPENAVKLGDTFQAPPPADSNIGELKFNMDLKYKILSISKCKRYVLLQPNGKFSVKSEEGKKEINSEENNIAGWVLLDLKRGFPLCSNMNMIITTDQMGQKIKVDMVIKINNK